MSTPDQEPANTHPNTRQLTKQLRRFQAAEKRIGQDLQRNQKHLISALQRNNAGQEAFAREQLEFYERKMREVVTEKMQIMERLETLGQEEDSRSKRGVAQWLTGLLRSSRKEV